MNVSTATTAELLAFFNANTGGAQVKKFADRKTAERRCQALADEMFAETQAMVAANPDYQQAAGIDRAPTEEENGEGPFMTEADLTSSRLIEEYGTDVCPHCGIVLYNGVGQHLQEVNGKLIKHDKYEFECLGCGKEFGPAIPNHYVRPSGKPIASRPEMAKSLKLDRQIESVLTGIVYKNACQVWKAGLVSASQGDRLSAVLYGAAKQGNRLMSITINGHVFALAVK